MTVSCVETTTLPAELFASHLYCPVSASCTESIISELPTSHLPFTSKGMITDSRYHLFPIIFLVFGILMNKLVISHKNTVKVGNSSTIINNDNRTYHIRGCHRLTFYTLPIYLNHVRITLFEGMHKSPLMT